MGTSLSTVNLTTGFFWRRNSLFAVADTLGDDEDIGRLIGFRVLSFLTCSYEKSVTQKLVGSGARFLVRKLGPNLDFLGGQPFIARGEDDVEDSLLVTSLAVLDAKEGSHAGVSDLGLHCSLSGRKQEGGASTTEASMSATICQSTSA